MAHVELRNINKKFRRHTALDDLSLDVGDGEFFVLLGPTGAGKTTTLRLIAGLDAPDSGSILIAGEDVGQWSAAERDVALVFQYYSSIRTTRCGRTWSFRSNPGIAVSAPRKWRPVWHGRHRPCASSTCWSARRPTFRRRDAARLPRPRDRAAAAGFLMDEPLSNLDAKLREILPRRAQGSADEVPRHLPLRHPRSGRAMSMGDRMRAQWWPPRPDRHPA